ncbi:hypothetical protein G7K_6652-t1 [Saitoella complicata NRRL Y-17804]|uniref:3-hydroxyisobutyrate dehydrogenase n=2 Tax=Saitoella complicata (strain BCRC 22490 / CBS 7301 / JCM 7358 / NBRC 10748 / NRRL Y-17804) TaxID=698492 RepID=A0A0E9NRT5_SAICN|nr:hypothetical protein G7K_6652-t1 [Saitoella complicata NRRL Y-17804]
MFLFAVTRRHRPCRSFTSLAPTPVRRGLTYAFIGLGQMGYPMALNLARKSDPSTRLLVHDISGSALRAFKADSVTGEQGAKVEICVNVDDIALGGPSKGEVPSVVMTMLPATQHVESVYTRLISAFPGFRDKTSLKKPITFIDSSTISPRASISLARRMSHLGKFVDAPVSGGTAGANAGTLTFMIGNTEYATPPPPLIESVLKKMGTNLLACGPTPGSGLKTKLVNNYLLAIQQLAIAETLALAEHMDLNPAETNKIINVSTGRSWSSMVNPPVVGGALDGKEVPRARGWTGGFGTALMWKDLGLCLDAVGANVSTANGNGAMMPAAGTPVGSAAMMDGAAWRTRANGARTGTDCLLDARGVKPARSAESGAVAQEAVKLSGAPSSSDFGSLASSEVQESEGTGEAAQAASPHGGQNLPMMDLGMAAAHVWQKATQDPRCAGKDFSSVWRMVVKEGE